MARWSASANAGGAENCTFEDRGPDPQELEAGFNSHRQMNFYVLADGEVTVCPLVLTYLSEYNHVGQRFIRGTTADGVFVRGLYKPLAHSEQNKRLL